MARVDSKGVIAGAWNQCVEQIENGGTFTAVLDFLEKQAIKQTDGATKDALKNCRGRWFELLFIFYANKVCPKENITFLKLGTSAEHGILDLFEGLKGKVFISHEFSINLSIPDVVVLNGELPKHVLEWKQKIIQNKRADSLNLVNELLQAYNILVDKPIDVGFCKAFCSLKTSLRPDRKYQAMYEAEFVRAMYKRISEFSKKGATAQYLMAGPLDANKTRQILESNLSLVSLADSKHIQIKTIDNVFTVNNLQSLKDFVKYAKAI